MLALDDALDDLVHRPVLLVAAHLLDHVAGFAVAPRSKFSEEIRRQLSEWIEEQPDLTLQQLQSRLRGELGLKASIGRLWSVLREMGLGLKNSWSSAPSRMSPPSRSGARSGVSR